ncbi:YdcF family protein [Pontibacter litorisediminis]|uniref:YdcF family protein n=1 Tax=Pontibacter litorisediminis TaxID=1846260 RepID=UPI0023EE166F|nr:YdcF family protein [Pontibacter litorisediminis]
MLEELIIRSLADTLPDQTLDALFLFGQTEDNQESGFAVARQLLEQERVQKVLFLKTKPLSGYPGYEAWHRELVSRGISPQRIEGIPDPGTAYLHTLIEAEAMAKHAKAKGYQTVAVAAAPFQQPRAFMAAATAARRHYPQLCLYSIPGKALPWCREATHSQGKVENTRAGLIAGEMERIHKYNAQGDLDSVGQVLSYLNRRDSKQL